MVDFRENSQGTRLSPILSGRGRDDAGQRRRAPPRGSRVRSAPLRRASETVEQLDFATGEACVAGYTFSDPQQLQQALTHASVADSRLESNERLEFLGDSVLGMVVCAELYARNPHWLEGELTKLKSFLVSRRICARMADDLGLTRLLILGNGINAQQALPMSLRAAVFESVVGAIFLDGGLEAAREVILRAVEPHIEASRESDNHDNHKSTLQHFAQRYLGAAPQYYTLDEQGPDHSKCFEVCVIIGGERYPSAWGASKKEAEQEAARRALAILREAEASGQLISP